MPPIDYLLGARRDFDESFDWCAERSAQTAADAEWESRPGTEKVSETELPGHAAWLDGSYKLHRLPQKKTGFTYELYDLAADPKEEHDIASQDSGRVEKMKVELDAWQKSVIHSLNGGDY